MFLVLTKRKADSGDEIEHQHIRHAHNHFIRYKTVFLADNTAVKRLRMCERLSGEKAAKMAVRGCGLKLWHSSRLTGVKNDHTSE